MFAFAVWDDRRRRLVLGRDRFGKKPLYYWHDGTHFAFGSEIKALLADPAVPCRLDADAIAAYLTFGYVPTPRTFFEGVRSLPPAHVLTVDEAGAVSVERYWQAPVPGIGGVEAIDCSFEEARAETRRLLCDAVDRRMVADVPLGAFLSGGVDSSTDRRLHGPAQPRSDPHLHHRFRRRPGFRRATLRRRGGPAATAPITPSSSCIPRSPS